ncbi:hypothetical protein DLM45_13885 [Hyphomicrobium methylovorum]|uniref:hypothetical protein n=1 Tax=Hyphomicrobium methylovorum TaxID=84 RepID=UPI0015E760A4|nr:hypothetical protein [Hyphomicrobium methylovorum]MBA2127306.1 hypothetical protein [Hyphomicrobium methylovorum]
MTKIAIALAALLAGTTLTSATNAGSIRVGFGFPLGSFVAHPHQNYDRGYDRDYDRRPAPRRIAQPKKPIAKPVVTAAKPQPKALVKTAKLEDKLSSDPATTTEIAKTTPAPNKTETAAPVTTASTTTTDSKPVKTAATPSTETKTASTAETKQICRRYSAATAGLVDVPCKD